MLEKHIFPGPLLIYNKLEVYIKQTNDRNLYQKTFSVYTSIQ